MLIPSVCGAADTESFVNPPQKPPVGVRHATFHSSAMQRDIGYNIYLPPNYERSDKRYPVVFYLPGMTDSESTHLDNVTVLDRVIRSGDVQPMILVYAFAGRKCWYTDSPDGKLPAETVIIKELIPHIDKTYRTLGTRAGRAVQGFSMGGYGALKFSLKYPDQFCAVGAVSPSLWTGAEVHKNVPEPFRIMFGGDEKRFDADSPWTLVKSDGERIFAKMPLWLAVGGKEGLVRSLRKMHDLLTEMKITHEYREVPGLDHNPRQLYEQIGSDLYRFFDEAFAVKK
jgi:endo-1,4-beta-xylanase